LVYLIELETMQWETVITSGYGALERVSATAMIDSAMTEIAEGWC
jgi:hypothetical protein